MNRSVRKTEQLLLPLKKVRRGKGEYDIYPSLKLDDNKIGAGLSGLAEQLSSKNTILVDGYVGVNFESFVGKLTDELRKMGKEVSLANVSDALKPGQQIDTLIKPFLGGNDPIFGKRTTLELKDFFDESKLKELPPHGKSEICIIYGPGASLSGITGTLLYIDLPKNELQFRSRAGVVSNLGASGTMDAKSLYKRYYFVDWVVLNKHKQTLLHSIDYFIDDQRPEQPSWMCGDDTREGLAVMAKNVFRVRPWFEPGTWGGQWIKERIKGLNKKVINYAWSFELIVPENGLLFESSGILHELSFDWLMYCEGKAVLGEHSEKYAHEFPIRFDFLDTFDGGNLSVQCHPLEAYMKNVIISLMQRRMQNVILGSRKILIQGNLSQH